MPSKITVQEAISTPEIIPLTWAGKVPLIQPATYADGLPVDELNYLSFKLILKPNSFTSRDRLLDLAKIVRKLSEAHGVRFTPGSAAQTPVRIREVLFRDTEGHRLYNNAFILRRRITYENGFPVGEPEVVFKFRHADIQKAAETDVRPHINGSHRVKFKAQCLPLKGQIGGMRVLFSHNVQFPRSSVRASENFTMQELTEVFPVLERIKKNPDETLPLVNNTIIEEVLQDLGVIEFDGLTWPVDCAIWRTRGEHRPLIAELAYQTKFKDRRDLPLEAMKRAERFFIALQYAAKDYLALDATKTGVVYRLLGNAPTSHE